jgi:hypothetical protein
VTAQIPSHIDSAVEFGHVSATHHRFAEKLPSACFRTDAWESSSGSLHAVEVGASRVLQ